MVQVTVSCRAVLAVLLLAFSAQAASAQSPSLFETESSGGKSKPVNLSRVVFDLTPGQVWGKLRGGVFCIPAGSLKWEVGRFEIDNSAYVSVFKKEMRSAGYSSGSNSLFEEEKESAGEFVIGARVKSIDARICVWAPEGGPTYRYGSSILNIEWQVYSRLKRTTVAIISTGGSFEIKRATNREVEPILIGAFARGAAALAETEEFRKIFDTDAPASANSGDSGNIQSAQIQLSGGPPAAYRPISEASGSVVLVLAGGSMGSGFLVSSDGYLITNAHVVGAEKTVRIRWSDGFESDGEVIRSHKARDVALIKTNPHGRQPLALRRGPPTPGTNVYAVGTPLDPKLQGSLTKGIVSANRIMDGFSFIQSDVAVTHGNSGGPLLDEKSVVVGITDLSFEPDGKPANINLFIPIGDALDFLNLKTAQEIAK